MGEELYEHIYKSERPAEKRKRKLEKYEDTLEERPWPVTPAPEREEVYADEAEETMPFRDYVEENIHWKDVFHKPECLKGIRVIDCSMWRLNGAACSSIFAEHGAEVIKVEPPGGDPLRNLTPFGRDEYMLKDKETGEPCGLEFINEMRNKQSITLNLDTERGRDILKRLVAQADVLIENHPPGWFDERGIGYRDLSKINPRLVYVYTPEIGGWGPSKDKTSKFGQWLLDPAGQCACEMMHSTGFPAETLPRERGGNPTRSGQWITDWIGGEHAYMAAIVALYYRDEVSGRGQFIECSSAEAYMDLDDYNMSWYGFDGSIKARTGGWDPCLNQYAWNPCKDGYMMIGGQTDRLWYRLTQCIEQHLPEFGRLIGEDVTFGKEVAARNAVQMLTKTYTATSQWLKDVTRAQSEKSLLEFGIAAGPLTYIDEIAEYPHFKYRGAVQRIEDEHYGRLLYAPSPYQHQHRAPPRVKWMGRPLGHDNRTIYSIMLGIGYEEQERLKEEGVI